MKVGGGPVSGGRSGRRGKRKRVRDRETGTEAERETKRQEVGEAHPLKENMHRRCP